MAQSSDALRAQLSRRLRVAAPPEWQDFTSLWMAFNALYGGEPDERERARVMAAVRRHLAEHAARAVLRGAAAAIERIVAIPPGSMAMEYWHPAFRRASRRLVRVYRTRSASPVAKLAAVAGILYQIRCNLIHGSKDPNNPRDRMLVRESVRVLSLLLPAIEDAAART